MNVQIRFVKRTQTDLLKGKLGSSLHHRGG